MNERKWEPAPLVKRTMEWERRVAAARSKYINGAERVNRLLNQGADPERVRKAEMEREEAAERWAAIARNGPDTWKEGSS